MQYAYHFDSEKVDNTVLTNARRFYSAWERRLVLDELMRRRNLSWGVVASSRWHHVWRNQTTQEVLWCRVPSCNADAEPLQCQCQLGALDVQQQATKNVHAIFPLHVPELNPNDFIQEEEKIIIKNKNKKSLRKGLKPPSIKLLFSQGLTPWLLRLTFTFTPAAVRQFYSAGGKSW